MIFYFVIKRNTSLKLTLVTNFCFYRQKKKEIYEEIKKKKQ